jgi:transcriptional antiterminator Rof (Rho-off)
VETKVNFEEYINTFTKEIASREKDNIEQSCKYQYILNLEIKFETGNINH